MSIPPLIGPVDTDASFMLASVRSGQAFILNSRLVPAGLLYYWESNITSIVTGQRLPVFTAQGTNNSLIIRDTVNGGGIGFRSDGTTITNVSSPSTLRMVESRFANWFPPDIFLSAVPYTLFIGAGVTGTVLTEIPGIGATGTTIPANNLVILPVLWYYNCTSSGAYNVINTPIGSATNWICVANRGATGCTGVDIVTSGWTNHPDCSTGNRYTYCATGTICGNSNCKGPCLTIDEDCNFSNGNYVCAFDITKFFTETQWWESPIFIGGVIAAVVIVIIIIIIIFLVRRK